jgi:hypothetical protein
MGGIQIHCNRIEWIRKKHRIPKGGNMSTSKIADWITIIVAPLTLLISLTKGDIQWQVFDSKLEISSTRAVAVNIVVTLVIWMFFYFSQLRIVFALNKKLSRVATGCYSWIINLIMIALYSATIMFVLDMPLVAESPIWWYIFIPLGIWLVSMLGLWVYWVG